MATLVAEADIEKFLLVADGTCVEEALASLIADFGRPVPGWSDWRLYAEEPGGGTRGRVRYTFCTERSPVGGAA